MLNLLGCSKDNFKKLLQKMNYKIFDKDDETYFKYNPIKKFKKDSIKKVSNENPFKILKNLNLRLNFMFFKKNSTETEKNFLVKTCALLIHAAKIDENYTESEEEIIKKTLLELGAKKENIIQIIKDAKSIEENSNQILDFTKEVKNLPKTDKIKIIEALWSIIYSNNDADIYETNLMRRLAGLLYIDSSTMGDIKDKIKKEKL